MECEEQSEMKLLDIIIKWNGNDYGVKNLNTSSDVKTLKEQIFICTGVRPERQKLINLRISGKMAPDDCMLKSIDIKPGTKIMMVGSKEEDIAEASVVPPKREKGRKCKSCDTEEFDEERVDMMEVHLAKVQNRIDNYEIKMLNEPRPGKKLLVLDIDYTLFDHRSVAESGLELMRPYLHHFLKSAYENYDIVIWSATDMRWIERKMNILNVSNNAAYNIIFYLDNAAMITVHTPKYGVVSVKPLGVIWGKFPNLYNKENTIMFDDIRRNFLMNPKNGLKIRPFREAHLNWEMDKELLHLAKYLVEIAKLDDFTKLNHRNWEKYIRKARKKEKRQKKERSDQNEPHPPDTQPNL
ncbi:ubiquitin-like domain-containing CTD phosphatase 1 isoform X1 [Adelges cooleyi]|uniref:ubiquitin-like domain-containing CTD phosphatase 1 isoform X1 n=2 Tax=Adelges cooleyi TaxID=133065 RepID=UPI00217FDBCA|nr:ubiquitin-like domain-containing CTD phosphatase 1 isoform X1 [Adelges cooleyi]